MTTRELYCDTCAAVVPFEQPRCLDGHDDGCPEWLCTACGDAILVAPPTVVTASRRRPWGRRSPVATPERHAA